MSRLFGTEHKRIILPVQGPWFKACARAIISLSQFSLPRAAVKKLCDPNAFP